MLTSSYSVSKWLSSLLERLVTLKRRQNADYVFNLFLPEKVTWKECIVDLMQSMWHAPTVELRWKELENMRKSARWQMRKKLCAEKTWKSNVKIFPKFWQTRISWRSTYTKERLFVCMFCDHEDNRSDNLKTHVTKNHSEIISNQSTVYTLLYEIYEIYLLWKQL